MQVRTSAAKAGAGPYNEHQAIPGGFTRHHSVFANVLQDTVRAGFPSKNFHRMTNYKTKETMLQLHRDISMATTGVDTTTSFYRTPGPGTQGGRPKTAHQRT